MAEVAAALRLESIDTPTQQIPKSKPIQNSSFTSNSPNSPNSPSQFHVK
ncbi:17425_t:CDS:1, partial [Racocetra fulgida]